METNIYNVAAVYFIEQYENKIYYNVIFIDGHSTKEMQPAGSERIKADTYTQFTDKVYKYFYNYFKIDKEEIFTPEYKYMIKILYLCNAHRQYNRKAPG